MISRLSQEQFKNQVSRIKNNQDQESRIIKFTVIDYQWQVLFSKSIQLNLQRSNQFQNGVIDYNILVINYQCV